MLASPFFNFLIFLLIFINVIFFIVSIFFSMGVLSYVFQLWEQGGWVDDLFDGLGWGGTLYGKRLGKCKTNSETV